MSKTKRVKTLDNMLSALKHDIEVTHSDFHYELIEEFKRDLNELLDSFKVGPSAEEYITIRSNSYRYNEVVDDIKTRLGIKLE